jgi:DNA-binding response OmpR family regulator
MTKNILLVDDESDITFTIKNILEENGFKVDEFNDPILALNNYQVNIYDIIILDIKMPKMDGFKLFTKIKEKDPKVKICFFTAVNCFMKNSEKHELNQVKQLVKTTLFKNQ